MVTPPIAAVRIQRVESPHGVREDPYFWLRDDTRSRPEVLAHLAAETAYADAVLARRAPLMEQLYQELIGRLKQDDSSVPVRFRGYWYTTRYVPGHEYSVVSRRPDTQGSAESVLLDCNALAGGHAFFQLGAYEASPDNRLLAYTEDVIGRRQYRLRILDIASGTLLADVIENVAPGFAWTSDSGTVLYVEKDPVTLLGRKVRAHVLGTPVVDDRLVYEEADEAFDLTMSTSKSDEYLLIAAESTTSSEWRYARADRAAGSFEVFLAREPEHEYQVDHAGDRFVVRTNWRAQNFRLMKAAPGGTQDRDSWQDILPHDPAVFIDDFDAFRGFVAVGERSGGLRKVRIQQENGASLHLAADDPAYTMWLASNPEADATRLRYMYSSLTTPASTFEYDIVSGERTLLKREPVLGRFDPADYTSEFLWVTARDGERVPVSVVHRRNVARDGTAPLHMYGYGAYGLSSDPLFSSTRLSLLDRGFVCAIAHVRGGQELGRRWYDAGRLQHKWNSFHDFLDVTDHLVALGYGAPDKIFASGGSAGGLLMGTVLNVAAEKFAGIVAHVPFVDIVTTMLDESIPLTTLEYDEWGDPHEREFYQYMLSYSPYDNLTARRYPALLVTTGLWDSQVQYYEPAKWVAKLRTMNTGTHPSLLHVNLEAGHGGKSGRYQRLREVAREYGFLIELATHGRDAWDAGVGR